MDSKKIIATALLFSGLLHGAIIFYYMDSSDGAEAEKTSVVISVGLISENIMADSAPESSMGQHRKKPEQRSELLAKNKKHEPEENSIKSISQKNIEVDEVLEKSVDVNMLSDLHNGEENIKISEAEEVTGEYRKRLLILLHDAINAHKKYPYMARRQRREGRVKVNFMLHPDGKITDIYIVHSSHYGLLDAAAKMAVESVSPFRSDENEVIQSLVFDVDVDFRIN